MVKICLVKSDYIKNCNNLSCISYDKFRYICIMYSNDINKFPCLELRLFIAIIVSIIIMIADTKFNVFFSFKSYVENSVYLVYYLHDKSLSILRYVSKTFIGYKKIILENDLLRKELFLKNSELLLIEQYKQENCKLHALLNSPLYNISCRLITKIISINIDPCNQQAIIDKGIDNDVYIGQPVITDSGVVGQVIAVNKISSRILLISDPSHAVPVKLQRNNIRMILMGRGCNAELYAESPGIIDIHINDMLVTSGLDGRFPEGYPVAIVSNIQINADKDCTIIRALPVVKLQCLRCAILIWE